MKTKILTVILYFVFFFGFSFLTSVKMLENEVLQTIISSVFPEQEAYAYDPVFDDDELECIQAMARCDGRLTLVCKLAVSGDFCTKYYCHLC